MTEPTEETPARPPVASSPLSVILLPAATSAEADGALAAWQTYLATLGRPFEIVDLRDGPLPEPLAEGSLRIVAISETGIGAAITEAIHTTTHPLVVTCPCDLQYRPEDLAVLLAAIDQVDLVTGFRVRLPIPLWRRGLDFLVKLGALVILGGAPSPRLTWLGSLNWRRRWNARWIFGVRVTDPECPFRLFRREVFQRMPLQAKGEFVQIEILAKANQLECLITEEPVGWTAPLARPPERFAYRADARLVFRDPTFSPRQAEPPPPDLEPTPAAGPPTLPTP
jgi:hypothetical protein